MSTSEERRRLQELYRPPADRFVLLDVPEMRFLMIDGHGEHETEAFAQGTRWLFSVLKPLEPVARERMDGTTSSRRSRSCGG